jgi:hypothetical protein
MGVHRKAWIAFYAVFTAVFCLVGYLLQHQVFTLSAGPGQVYVLAFEQNPKAVLRLNVSVYPNDPAADKVTATVVRGKPGRWVVVVDCANTPDTDVFLGNATLTTLAPSLAEGQHAVNAWAQPARASRFSSLLGCFQPRPSGVYSIDNVTLPALGTDDAMGQMPGGVPTLYLAGSTLAQVFPGEQCPASPEATGTPGTGAATPTLDATGIAGATATAGASPRQTRTAGATASPGPTASAAVTESPSPAASPSPTVTAPQPTESAPACLLAAVWPQDSFTGYAMPTVLQAQETVQKVNFGAYIFESDYPTATYPKTGGYMSWNGGAGLAPSLDVSDPASDRTLNQDTFYSGILFGLAGATGLAAIDQIERWLEDHEPAPQQEAHAPVPAAPSFPSVRPDARVRRRPPRASRDARERRRTRALRQVKRWRPPRPPSPGATP